MSTNEPVLIAHGRNADIFNWHSHQVIKLYHEAFSDNARHEHLAATIAHKEGLPVPEIFELVEVNKRTGIVMERLDGETMWNAVERYPNQGPQLAESLAPLHLQMNLCRMADAPLINEFAGIYISQHVDLPRARKKKTLEILATLSEGNVICHGDFYPGNIIVSRDSPYIVDWEFSLRGDYHADFART